MKTRFSLLSAAALGFAAVSAPVAAQDANDILVPDVSNRGAFVSQIGENNVATVTQTASDASSGVSQDGSDNSATVVQRGNGLGFVDVRQSGNGNAASSTQDGVGQNVLYIVQTGDRNTAFANQLAEGGINNGAVMSQFGSDNSMSLIQEDGDNRATLAQDGNSNAMSAVQNGTGNRLTWSQQGDGLSNLQITQPGGQAMQITQSIGGIVTSPANGGR